jgi:hypothetical protein
MFFSFNIYVGFNARESVGRGAIGTGVFACSPHSLSMLDSMTGNLLAWGQLVVGYLHLVNSHVLLIQYLFGFNAREPAGVGAIGSGVFALGK